MEKKSYKTRNSNEQSLDGKCKRRPSKHRNAVSHRIIPTTKWGKEWNGPKKLRNNDAPEDVQCRGKSWGGKVTTAYSSSYSRPNRSHY